MPELPEVETLAQQLRRRLTGKKIIFMDILDRKVVEAKIKKILPTRVIKVWRRAKSIIIELEKENYLLVHLRMTGHFHYLPKKQQSAQDAKECEKFLTARFYLDNGDLLTHNDIRRFGFIRLFDRKKMEQELAKLGPEPLSEEFTKEKLNILLNQRKKANIKTTLMDQHVLAGVGNIYAQEVLYHAKINPTRKIESILPAERNKIYLQLRKVLNLAIKHHGTTVENYVHIEGTGGFQKYLAVYGREKCPKKHLLKKISLGGRGTYYCPQCQC